VPVLLPITVINIVLPLINRCKGDRKMKLVSDLGMRSF
jgi:hypothetical protein